MNADLEAEMRALTLIIAKAQKRIAAKRKQLKKQEEHNVEG